MVGVLYYSLTFQRWTLLSVLAVHQPFYISICISTLLTQHTTFIYNDIYIYAQNTRQNSTTLYLPPCVNIFAKQKSRLSMFLPLAGFLINMADKKDEKNVYNVSCLEFNGDKSNESF